MDRDQLVAYLDDLLDVDEVSDVAINGLQVAGRREVRRVATAVSASAELFVQSAAWGADAVLVHHGLLWRGDEPPRLVGSFRERVRLLLENDLNLIAYHLPLDRHPGHGNAAVLARALGLDRLERFGVFSGVALGFAGVFPEPVSIEELVERVGRACGQEPLAFAGGPERVASVGIVTGGAPSGFDEAVANGLDAYLTGEAREWVYHRAAEDGVHFIAAGHHATERFGVVSLGELLARRHGLEVQFFDVPNPV
ncbi:MAG TPA: Nif3-like dinuclear metal center hexameric protein [Thermoanaerobaculaceae bacterium]|nr:Nif3-like dinuclear metal center hexameric protein [Thermoanaerobaculaceae bacterium]HRS16052.1 Nif3-like dinuclear metal center hexameric protein [Thermoanaerobaculaceae bacterium]